MNEVSMKEDNVYTVSLVFAHQIKHELAKERHMYITLGKKYLLKTLIHLCHKKNIIFQS